MTLISQRLQSKNETRHLVSIIVTVILLMTVIRCRLQSNKEDACFLVHTDKSEKKLLVLDLRRFSYATLLAAQRTGQAVSGSFRNRTQ